jgi:hypothetical protein
MREISPHEYPWIVGHRLKSSRVRLPYRKALEYFESLKHCKTRKMWQDIPLDVVITNTFAKCSKDIDALITTRNPILEMLKKHGAMKA